MRGCRYFLFLFARAALSFCTSWIQESCPTTGLRTSSGSIRIQGSGLPLGREQRPSCTLPTTTTFCLTSKAHRVKLSPLASFPLASLLGTRKVLSTPNTPSMRPGGRRACPPWWLT
ncbi:hypothetical protein EDD17DRAFT_1189931 [Pisolithus thermaeus]|nr:hypothetical protein EV401DRAFT_1245419 [Pisolithus croceorrhizus]KAI6150030.1 hypothetical protein EDD17DRAFT_1189931 [Pisolithus thermaeus]